uniref:Octanoyl-[acyl-carrier-protein]:protein N-octanoyltransferase LIPT2, mitochondrial n=1 Tax=Ascaris lumbricoides TaxID=6252 RepID=A0A0M3HZD3_ASCLU
MRLTRCSLRASIEAIWLGRLSYGDALKLQRKFVDKLVQAKEAKTECPVKNFLLLLEHTPVYTVGLRSHVYSEDEERRLKALGADFYRNFLLLLEHTPVYTVGLRSHVYSEDEERRLKALGADFYRTDRGGLITFHGPGQLVAYPIIDLSSLSVHAKDEKTARVGVRRFVHLVEEAIIRTVDLLGVSGAHRSPDTGVWLGNGTRKIAAIGINVRRGITSHGLALNCNTDLSWFEQIVPCGLIGKEVTSLSKEMQRNVTVNEAIRPLYEQFASVYQCDISFHNALENDELNCERLLT